jgi:long-subunit acyl-CoA synthetase (AMP-forming)
MLTHRNVTWMARAVAVDNPIFDTDEVLSFLPLCHIFERIFSVLAHVTHGYTVNFVGALDVFRKLNERLGFERIRVAYSGAAPIAPDVLAFFQAIGVNLIEGYGQTEGTGVTTLSPSAR